MEAATMAAISTVLTVASTALTATTASQSMNAQASADQRRAEIQADWADRQAKDERAGAQREAANRMREARFAQSRLTSQVGASGTGADDATVMDLFGDIEKEGQLNAANATAAGEQKASGTEYQANLDRYTADANARIKRYSANSTLIGGLLSAGGQAGDGYTKYQSRMAARYSQPGTSQYRYG